MGVSQLFCFILMDKHIKNSFGNIINTNSSFMNQMNFLLLSEMNLHPWDTYDRKRTNENSIFLK